MLDFGKYKKAKYSLYVDSRVPYSFVTTTRSEEECLMILLEMTEFYRVKDSNKSYKITVKTSEGERVLCTGKIQCI